MTTQFYGGSTILSPFADIIGLPVDQINFIFCSLLSIAFGQFMRYKLNPAKYSPKIRSIIETIFGMAIVIFCYGYQVKYLIFQSSIAYLMLLILPPNVAAHLVTYWSMIFMSIVHLYRLHYDYGGYTLDISGPVMIQTQKLTSLAFNLYDGHRLKTNQKLSKSNHEEHAVKSMPNPIEFFTYTLYYHGILAGPFVYYNEYQLYLKGYHNKSIPNAKKQLSTALCLSVIHGLLTAYVAPQFPYIFVCSVDYQRMHMMRRIMFTMISFFLVRQKYYFAWSIVEAGALSAGLGYNGKNQQTGQNDFSLVKNYDFAAIESGRSMKEIVDGWNISTTRWLRELIYDRAPLCIRLPLVFITSAFWHGFYPGYYLMFLTFALITVAARKCRRHIRPIFASNPLTLQWYHVLTKIFANLSLNYGQAPFYLLELQSSLLFWKPYYFFGHLFAIFIIACFHFRPIIAVKNDKILNNIRNTKLGKSAHHKFKIIKDQIQRTLG